VWVWFDVGVLDVDDAVEAGADGDGLPPSDPEEQPARTVQQTTAAAVAARIG
jgi:hypothetical protein